MSSHKQIHAGLTAIHSAAKLGGGGNESLMRLVKYVHDDEVRVYPFEAIYQQPQSITKAQWASKYSTSTDNMCFEGLCFPAKKLIFIACEEYKDVAPTIVHELAHYDNRRRGLTRFDDEMLALQTEELFKGGDGCVVDCERVQKQLAEADINMMHLTHHHHHHLCQPKNSREEPITHVSWKMH